MNNALSQTMLGDFLRFVRRPELDATSLPFKWSQFIGLLLSCFVIIVPYALILEYLDLELDHKLEEMLKNHKLLLVGMAVVAAPILEETVFRYHLSLSKSTVLVSLLVSLLLIGEYRWINGLISGYLVFILVMLQFNQKVSFTAVYYSSALLFALIHMSNFSNFDFKSLFYLVPVLVFVQFLLGLIMGYLRVAYGFWYAVLFHALYNGSLVIPTLIWGDQFMQ
jgi:hypothetical protein